MFDLNHRTRTCAYEIRGKCFYATSGPSISEKTFYAVDNIICGRIINVQQRIYIVCGTIT